MEAKRHTSCSQQQVVVDAAMLGYIKDAATIITLGGRS
jgi:hypothetical protein